MDHAIKISELFEAYGKHNGIDGLQMPENGCCRIDFQDGVSMGVDLLPVQERLMLTVPVLELPQEDRAEIYADLMELNLFWENLAGARFAYMKESGLIVLTHQLRLERTDSERFIIAVENLAKSATFWRDSLNGRFIDEDSASFENDKQNYIRA